MVSECLAKAMQNRPLVLASNANLDRLCATLCSMVRTQEYKEYDFFFSHAEMCVELCILINCG